MFFFLWRGGERRREKRRRRQRSHHPQWPWISQPNWHNRGFLFRSSSANGKSGRSIWGSEVLSHQPRRVQVNFVSVNTNNRFDVTTSAIGHQLWQRSCEKPSVLMETLVDGRSSASRRLHPMQQYQPVSCALLANGHVQVWVARRANGQIRFRNTAFIGITTLQSIFSLLSRSSCSCNSHVFYSGVVSCHSALPLSIHFTCLPFLDMISQSTLADTFTRRFYPG